MTTVLRYPYEAITETTDYLQIAIKKYVAGGLPTLTSPSSRRRIGKATDVGATASSVAELVDDGIILLPMPSNIQDSNSVGYGDDTINSYAAAAAGLVSKTINEGNIIAPETLVDQIGKNGGLTLNTLIEDEDARLAVNRYFASQAVNVFGANVSPDQILARSVGRIFTF